MVFYCCVPSCSNNGKNVHMHRFPANRTQICDIWLRRIARDDLQTLNKNELYTKYRICEEHFHQNCILPQSSRRLKLGSLPIWNLGGTEYTIEDCVMVPKCKSSSKVNSLLDTPCSSTALEKIKCTHPITKCAIIEDSFCAVQGSAESSSDNNEVPAKKAKRHDSVYKVSVSALEGTSTSEKVLKFSVPIINPSEGTSSKLVQYESQLSKKLNLRNSITTNYSLITKESTQHSRQGEILSKKLPVRNDEVNSRTTKIETKFFEHSKKDIYDQNEGSEDQMNDDIFFESQTNEFGKDNRFEVLYVEPETKNVCTRNPSEHVTETDEAIESSNEFDIVDDFFHEMDQDSLDSQSPKPDQASLEFQHLCRVCLSTSNLIHLTECQSHVALFVNITNIKVEIEDNLPKYMCAACIQNLEGISNFINVAKKNDEKLKQTILVDEEMYIVLSDNEVEESLSAAEDISNISRKVISHEIADIESEKTESSTELDSEKPLDPELIILNKGDLLKNKSVMPLLKRGGREDINIENDKDFHNKSLQNQGPKLSTSPRKDSHLDKNNYCICEKCGVLFVGLKLPKALAAVPRHRLKFFCQNCSNSKVGFNRKPTIYKRNET